MNQGIPVRLTEYDCAACVSRSHDSAKAFLVGLLIGGARREDTVLPLCIAHSAILDALIQQHNAGPFTRSEEK
jgi:hypothetical protein